ncbi:MAG: ERCC4 domain-containing protein, partial [Promethearchaeota archaeon]
MKIILDCREQRLEKSLKTILEKYNNTNNENSKTKSKKINIELVVQHLIIGDIHILNDNNELLSIIERKTIKDLLSSLRDGRYKEQSFRLNECELENKRICYLLEGIPLAENKSVVNGCMVSLAINKGFSLLSTKNIDETAELLMKICEKIDNSAIKKDYCEAVHISKKSQTTKDNISEIMLTQIPNVSINIAKIVCEKYNTIKELINALEENRA